MKKRYYWLKLKEDFFKQLPMKKIRKIAGGDTYTIIYLKMMLQSLSRGGNANYYSFDDDFISNLALEIDEDVDNVKITVNFLIANGLLVEDTEGNQLLTEVPTLIGSEQASAQRVREHRARLKAKELVAIEQDAKTNAERQAMYRAKKYCSAKQHVPCVDDYENRTRYNGNYYIVFKRDMCKCKKCSSIENLCVHHIDGYDEMKPQNNEANKMVVLCRACHSQVHAGKKLSNDILESIGYFDEKESKSVTSNEKCNTDVTKVKRNGNGDIDIEIEKEKLKEKEKVSKNVTLVTENADVFDFAADAYCLADADNPCLQWEQIVGLTLTAHLAEKIRDLYEEVGAYAYEKALKIACERNKRNFKYIEATARGIAEGNDYEEQRKAEKAKAEQGPTLSEEQKQALAFLRENYARVVL